MAAVRLLAALCGAWHVAAQGGPNTFGFPDNCGTPNANLTSAQVLQCLAVSPTNRGHTSGRNRLTEVFFRPEVVGITEISDPESDFWVKIDTFFYWTDPAIADHPEYLNNEEYYEALWRPKLFMVEELESTVLLAGSVKWLNGEYPPLAKRHGPERMLSANLGFRQIVRYRVSNVGKWKIKKYPFDSRELQWTWQNAEVWARRKLDVTFVPLDPLIFPTRSLATRYNGAEQSNDFSKLLPSAWVADGAMMLTQSTQCSADDTEAQIGVDQRLPIRREWQHVSASYLVPVSLLSLIGIGSLWVPISIAMPRFAASVISMLTVATIKRSLDAALPASGQESLLVVWLVLQMAILGMASLMTILGFFLRTGGAHRDGDKIQSFMDRCYRSGILYFFVASFPASYAMIQNDSWTAFAVLVLFVPQVALAFRVWLFAYKHSKMRTRWSMVASAFQLAAEQRVSKLQELSWGARTFPA